MSLSHATRRDFVKRSTGLAVAAATPYFFSSPRSLAQEATSKNDRLKFGLIGGGGMGIGNMQSARDWIDVVVIADADTRRAAEANKKLSDGKADEVVDYRKVLERKDLDALHIATPDHWHAKPLIEALHAGFDVYCEKPLTLTIDEAIQVRKAVEATGRIVQVGTQQRSTFDLFVKAMAIVAEGRLGKIKKLQAAIGGGPSSAIVPVAEPPQELDWDLWLGPTPKVDYRILTGENLYHSNCHYEFRWWYQFSGGKLTDWGAHHIDIATWALQVNGQSGIPVAVGGEATHPMPYIDGYPVESDRYNTATKFNLKVEYPDGVELVVRDDTDNGVLIEGDKGRIFVNRGKLVGAAVEELKDNPLPEDALSKVYKGFPMEHNERKAHWANFIHCLQERKQPISDVASHVTALNTCHLCSISARLGRRIEWDGSAEQIVGDEQANSFLARPYRKGYEIEV